MLRVELNGAADSAYGLQSHVGTKAAVSGIDNVAAVSGKIDMDNDITTSYAVQAGLFIMEGAGSITGNSYAIQGVVENATTITSMLALGGSGTATNVFELGMANRTNFIEFASVAGPLTTSATALSGVTTSHKLKCIVGGTTFYIPVVTSGMA